MIRNARSAWLFPLLLLAGSWATARAAERLTIYTVNYPLTYFAGRIGGEHVRVVFPAPADVDPAFWRPGVATVRAYQSANLVLINGAGYAKWLSGVSLPRRRLVDTSREVADRYLEAGTGVAHSHGPGGGASHSHGRTAFTLWLDPELAIAQVGAIAAALTRARPDAAADFEAGRQDLEADLWALDAAFADAFRALPPGPLLASHPVYQYLGRRYDRGIDALVWEPEVAPDAAAWRELDRLAAEGGARWMLWEAEPAAATRAELEERGIGVIVLRPLGNRPAIGDYLEAMAANVAAIRAATETG